jgi:hypothetical protein
MTDITAKLAEALDNLLAAFHGFDDGKSKVIDAARAQLAAYRRHIEAQAGGAEGEREAFEAELRDEEEWGHHSFGRFKNGDYKAWRTAFAWAVWQAALAASPAAAQGATATEAGKERALQLLDSIAYAWATADHRVAELRAWIEALTTQPAAPVGWQPIETAPQDGTWFIVYARRCGPRVMSVSYNAAICEVTWADLCAAIEATLWTPLLPAPKTGGANG